VAKRKSRSESQMRYQIRDGADAATGTTVHIKQTPLCAYEWAVGRAASLAVDLGGWDGVKNQKNNPGLRSCTENRSGWVF